MQTLAVDGNAFTVSDNTGHTSANGNLDVNGDTHLSTLDVSGSTDINGILI